MAGGSGRRTTPSVRTTWTTCGSSRVSLSPWDRSLFDRAGLYDIRSTPSGIVMGKIAPTEDLLRSAELLHSAATLLPRGRRGGRVGAGRGRCDAGLTAEAFGAIAAPVGGVDQAGGFADRHDGARDVGAPASFPAVDGCRLVLDERELSSLRPCFSVEHQVEQAPDPANRVRLGRRRDEYGRPTLDLSWRWSELDLSSARATQDLFGQAVESDRRGHLRADGVDRAAAAHHAVRRLSPDGRDADAPQPEPRRRRHRTVAFTACATCSSPATPCSPPAATPTRPSPSSPSRSAWPITSSGRCARPR